MTRIREEKKNIITDDGHKEKKKERKEERRNEQNEEQNNTRQGARDKQSGRQAYQKKRRNYTTGTAWMALEVWLYLRNLSGQ